MYSLIILYVTRSFGLYAESLLAILSSGTLPSPSPNSTFTLITLSGFLWESITTVSTCHECAIKMHLPVTYSLSLGIFMMLWLRLEPEIWLLHPDASAIEKIKIDFIDEP